MKPKPITVEVEVKMKEPKTISKAVEARMRDLARESIEKMSKLFPAAREIDLLNAYLIAFTNMAQDE